MRAGGSPIPIMLAAALLPGVMPGTALAQPAAGITVQAVPQPIEWAVIVFIVFAFAIAAGLATYAWRLRRDYLDLVTTAPRDPGVTTDRLTLYRDSPFGLPEGSIRAIIAIAIVLVAMPALVLARAFGMTTTGELGTILGGVLGFYFGSRNSGDADAARRQADQSLRVATAAQEAQAQAEQVAEQARTEAAAADSTAQARAAETGEAASRLTELTQRAAEGVAVAKAIAAMLPASQATSVLGTVAGAAGAVIAGATNATAAVQEALKDPSAENVGRAVEAAAAILKAAGEGTEVATRLGTALQVVQQATGAIGAVTDAVRNPSATNVAAALQRAGGLLGERSDGGLGSALAPALGVLGTVMRVPGVAGALGAATPVGLAAGVVLGAVQAAQLGNAHYRRWMARVLDRPVSRDLLPGGEWDGEAARELLLDVPRLAQALAARVDGTQAQSAEAVRRLLDPDALAWLKQEAPDAFASDTEAESAIAALRRKVLEQELDKVDSAAVRVSDSVALGQASLRADLDRLREAGAGEALDTLALLADGVIQAKPDVPGAGATALNVTDLLNRALATAAAEGKALEQPPPPPPPEPV